MPLLQNFPFKQLLEVLVVDMKSDLLSALVAEINVSASLHVYYTGYVSYCLKQPSCLLVVLFILYSVYSSSETAITILYMYVFYCRKLLVEMILTSALLLKLFVKGENFFIAIIVFTMHACMHTRYNYCCI